MPKSTLSTVFIRHATPADYKACQKITNQKENRPGLGFVSRIIFNEFAQKQIHEQRHMLFVAENEDGNVIGFVRALRLLKKDQTTVHEICRDVTTKGAGVGKALLDKVINESINHGVGLIFLKTPDGIDAGRLYEKYGFKKVGLEKPAANNNLKRTLRWYEKKLNR